MSGKLEHTLTKQQQEIVDFKGNEVLIRGIAGSGKTLILLKKAKQTAEKYPNEKVAIFTYSSTLTNAAKLLMENFKLSNILFSYLYLSWLGNECLLQSDEEELQDVKYKIQGLT